MDTVPACHEQVAAVHIHITFALHGTRSDTPQVTKRLVSQIVLDEFVGCRQPAS